MDWTPAIPIIGAVIHGAFRLIAYVARLRAIMRATPEQLAAIEKIEPPVFLRRGGPALVMLAAGGALTAWPMLREHQLARKLEGCNSVAKAVAPGEDRSSGCNDLNCPRPGRCVDGKCQGNARKPPQKRPPPPDRAPAAIAGQPDSAVEHANTWDSSPGAFADRVPWLEQQ